MGLSRAEDGRMLRVEFENAFQDRNRLSGSPVHARERRLIPKVSVTRHASTLTRAKRHCHRTRIALGAFPHRELQGDGAVTRASAPHALPEFGRQPGGQRVTHSAKSHRTGIPIIQVDADRDTRHDDNVSARASTEGDGSRCW